MKQYLLFIGESFYPSGGWDDFVKDSDDLEELKDDLRKACLPTKWGGPWGHIVGTESKKIVLTNHDASL